jgi:2-aminomuconate deaminase
MQPSRTVWNAPVTEAIHADGAPVAVGSYPHARRSGNLLFLSGIGPRSAADNSIPGNVYDSSGKLQRYDIAAQCRSVLANVRTVLESAGVGWNDLIDVTVYLTDMENDFPTYNRIWAEYFPDAGQAPCRTTLGITALPTPIAIELKCIAAVKEKPCC